MHRKTHVWFGLLAVAIALCVTGSQATAQDEDQDDKVVGEAASSYSLFGKHTVVYHYDEVRGFEPRPDDEVLEEITVTWQEPELDGLGGICTLRGRMTVPGEDGDEPRPMDWFQGIFVYVAMQPATTLDWSNGINDRDTLFERRTTNRIGEFSIRVDLRETGYDRQQARPFQIGVALADHSPLEEVGQRVEWTTKTAPIAATVSMLNIPIPQLPPEMELVHQAAGWPVMDSDPTRLIQAVNALHALGKDKALETLEEYVRLTDGDDYWFNEQEHVFWIIRALFEPIRLDERIPQPLVSVHLVDRYLPEAKNWPLAPMAIVNDIPFLVGQRAMGSTGFPEHPSSHIRWVRAHGALRDEPLRPSVDPLTAAKSLLTSERLQQLEDHVRERAVGNIRGEALAMLRGVVPDLPELSYDDEEAEKQWSELVERVKTLDIQWDQEQQRFALR